jgi:hypothetical protein
VRLAKVTQSGILYVDNKCFASPTIPKQNPALNGRSRHFHSDTLPWDCPWIVTGTSPGQPLTRLATQASLTPRRVRGGASALSAFRQCTRAKARLSLLSGNSSFQGFRELGKCSSPCGSPPPFRPCAGSALASPEPARGGMH